MKLKWTLTGALLALAAGYSMLESSTARTHDDVNISPVLTAKRPHLFKMLDFSRFKAIFGKEYDSLAVNMARMRIFLARCLKSFVSIIKFMQGKSSSYRSINQMSDWTKKERSRLYMRSSVLKGERAPEEAPLQTDDNELEVRRAADREARDIQSEDDVERKIIDLAKRDSDSSSRAIVGALGKPRKERGWLRDVANMLNGMFGKIDRLDEEATLLGARIDSDGIDASRSFAPSSKLTLDGSLPKGIKSTKGVKVAGGPDDEELIIDHRPCFNEVADQDQCGSCYVFSSISVLEWHYCKANNGKRAKFAEQFLIDCGREACTGGWPRNVLDFSFEHGLEPGEMFPYFARYKKCVYGRPMRENGTSGFWRVEGLSYRYVPEEDLETELEHGPIVVQLAVTDEFTDYGGGIDDLEKCDPNGDRHHAMVLVGRGRQGGQDFWLIRNSHSVSWGEQGYYKISLEAFARCFTGQEKSSLILEGKRVKFKRNPFYNHEKMKQHSIRWHQQLANKKNKTKKKTY